MPPRCPWRLLFYTRKNLVVAVAGGCCTSPTAPAQVQIVDPGTGALIWQSPPLLGGVSKNGVELLDASGTGQPQMSLGTAWGMYLTQKRNDGQGRNRPTDTR